MSILVDKRHTPRGCRNHRQRGFVPHAQQPQLRHERRRRRDARQGRTGCRGHSRVRQLGAGRQRGAAEHGNDLRAAPVRGRFDPRGGRGRRGAGDRDHRGDPGARRATRVQHAQARPSEHAPDRAQLPRHPLPRQGQCRDHPCLLLQRGQRRRGVALGHADLPDRQRDRPGRLWLQLDRRDRRRSCAGLLVRGHHRAVPEPTSRPS